MWVVFIFHNLMHKLVLRTCFVFHSYSSMAYFPLPLTLLLVVLLVCHKALSSDNGDVAGPNMDEEELFRLYDVMTSLLDDSSWPQTHPLPCTDTPWPGLECELIVETSTFHVTKIHVGPDVADTDPPCKSSAKLSKSLLKLPFLKTLSLISCFTQSPFYLNKPPVFEAPSSLEHLALVSNPSLSGEIPNSVSNLENLSILSLSQNNLSGEIPIDIGKLANLQQLDLNHNKLTGSIPDGIGSLGKLEILDLSWNFLENSVPASIGELQCIEKIDLSSNRLRGELPQELGKLWRLTLLDLSHNSLTGPIPESLSNLQELQYLIMEANPLNMVFPSFLGSLSRLRVMSFSGCGLRGPISPTLANLTNLTALSLDNNTLNGTVPAEIGELRSLNTLNLSRNQLSGELLFPPEFMNRLGSRLDIRDNKGLCSNSIFPAANNTTVEERDPDRAENMKPKLFQGVTNSGTKHGLSPGLALLFLLFIGL